MLREVVQALLRNKNRFSGFSQSHYTASLFHVLQKEKHQLFSNDVSLRSTVCLTCCFPCSKYTTFSSLNYWITKRVPETIYTFILLTSIAWKHLLNLRLWLKHSLHSTRYVRCWKLPFYLEKNRRAFVFWSLKAWPVNNYIFPGIE